MLLILLLIQISLILNPVQASCGTGCLSCDADGVTCLTCDRLYISTSEFPDCHLCPGGTSWTPSNQSGASCEPCLPGTFSLPLGESCELCPLGSISSLGASVCTLCPPGQYSYDYFMPCDPCPLGSFAANPGSSSCSFCKAGEVASSDGTACEACAVGYYAPFGSPYCLKCPAGSFARDSSSSSCDVCPLGLFSSEGAVECSPCPAGSVPDNTQGSCVSCGPGMWANSGDFYCSYCPAGFIFNMSQGACVPCEPGLWADPGNSECLSKPDIWALINLRIGCGEHCNVCESSKNCQECAYPTRMLGGSCFFSCPLGQFFSEGGCKDCPANCQECHSQSDCTICESGYALQFNEKTGFSICSPQSKNTEEAATKASSVGLAATGVVAKSLSSGSSSAFGFGVVAKVVRNARYFSIAYSKKTQEIFTAEESSSFEINAPAYFDETETKELHENFVKYDVEPNFLINYWGNLIPILILAGIFTILKILKRYLSQSKKRKILTNKIVMMFQVTAGNYLVNSLYGSFDEIVLYFLLETQTCTFDSGFSWTSFIFALLFLAIGIGYFGFHFYILKGYQAAKLNSGAQNQENNDEKRLENFKSEHAYVKVLFEDFKDETLAQQSFLASFMLRASLLNVLLCLFVNHPVVEACLYLVVNLAFAIFLVLKRPYEELKGAIAQYFCEIIILITYTGVLILTIMDHVHAKAENSRQILEKMIVTLGIVLNLGGTVFQLIDILGTIHGVYKSFLAWRARIKIVGAPVGMVSKAMGNHVDLTFMKVKKTNSDLEITPKPLDVSSTPSHLKEEDGGLIRFSGSPTRLIVRNLDTETEGLTLPSTSKSLNNLFMNTEGSQSDLENGRSMVTQVPLKSITVMEEKENVDDDGEQSLRIEIEQGLMSSGDNEEVDKQRGI